MISTTRRRTRTLVRRIPILMITALLSVWIVSPATMVAAENPGAADNARVRLTVADRLARSAVMMLRLTKPPMPVDYQLCAEQLRLALSLDPGNPHMLRLMREAYYRAGEQDEYNETTRALAALEPQDTVLQLAVISGRITAIQNADDRLAAYERLLGASGASLDDSVLSRLAFDAAMLAQEQGDAERFVRMLTRATQLDSTNKPAAARAADYFLEHESDPKGRIELLANVILADPLDPSAHLNLSREFLRHGATHAAERFLNHTVALWKLSGYQQDEGTLLQRYALQWLHEGGKPVLDDLDELESVQRYVIIQQRRSLEEAGEDPAQVNDFKPDPVMERVRLAIASAEGNDELAESSILKIEKGIYDFVLQAQEALKGEDPPPADEVEKAVTGMRVQSLYLRLWSGHQVEKAEGTIEQLVSDRKLTPEAIERFRGWIAARNGEQEKANRLLLPTSKQEPFAMLGIGVAAERVDDRRGAIRAYAQVALDGPGTLMGVWAQKRLERLLGSPLTPTPVAKELEALAGTLPKSIDRMVRGPDTFLSLSSECVSTDLDRLGRVLVRVKLRNNGTIPVGVGERCPVRASALMIPRVVLGGIRAIDSIDSEAVSLDRRLRLMPRETMTVEVWADLGQTGTLLDVDAVVQATVRWRTILGFDVDTKGQYAKGGYSLECESDMSSRGRLTALGDNIEDVALAIELAEPGEPLVLTLLKARSILLRTLGSESPDASEIQSRVCEAIATRFTTMSEMERAFTLVMMPPAQTMPPAQQIDDNAVDDPDPLCTILFLRRLQDPDSEWFTRAMASDDPTIRQLATLLHHRIDRVRRINAGNAGNAAAGAENDPGL